LELIRHKDGSIVGKSKISEVIMSTSFGVKTEIWENVANSAVHKATRKSVTGDKEDAEAR